MTCEKKSVRKSRQALDGVVSEHHIDGTPSDIDLLGFLKRNEGIIHQILEEEDDRLK